jgi:predicted GNAT family acetyltransferase
MADVVDNPALSRLEIVEDAGIAVLEYRIVEDRLALIHTGVPKQFEGMGYGSALVKAAIERARAEQLTIIPYCPYARAWIEGHPEAVEGVSVASIG